MDQGLVTSGIHQSPISTPLNTHRYLIHASLIRGSLWGVWNPDQCPHLHHRTPINKVPLRSSRSFKVAWGGEISKAHQLVTGVPQGSFLDLSSSPHTLHHWVPYITTQLLVQALVISRLDYCNALQAGLPSNTIKPLQIIQNAAARLVFNKPKRAHVTPLFVSLH